MSSRPGCLRGIAAGAALFACAMCPAAEASALAPLFRAVSGEYRALDDERHALHAELEALPAAPMNQQSERLGFQIWRGAWLPEAKPVWVEVDLGKVQPLDAIVLVPVDAPYRDFAGPGYGFPARFRVEIRDEASALAQIVADCTTEDFPNPGGLPVWLAAQGRSARFIRVTMTQPWRQGAGIDIFALGEIMVMRGNYNFTAGLPASAVTASETFESLRVWGKANLIDGQSVLGPPSGAEPSPTRGYHSEMADRADVTKWVQVDLGESVAFDEVRLIGARVAQFPGRRGFGFPVRFKVEAADDAAFMQPVMLADETAEDFPNPASNPVSLPCAGKRGRFIRVTATKLWERAENFAFTLAELQVYARGKNIALGKSVTCLDQYPLSKTVWRPANLTDGFSSEHRLVEWPGWLQGLSGRREAMLALGRVESRLAVSHAQLRRWFSRAMSLLGALVAAGITFLLVRQRRVRRRELETLRRRIASDLHDDIGSNLGNIALLSEMAIETSTGEARADVEEIHRIARQTADSMRDIIWLIQRPAVTADDFMQRLRAIATRTLTGIEWTFDDEGLCEVPPLDTQRHLLLACKEALHNIRKHARATRVQIALTAAARRLRLDIRDDGAGFDANAAHDGHGLSSLRHRALTLGGDLQITSAPGEGTRLIITAKI